MLLQSCLVPILQHYLSQCFLKYGSRPKPGLRSVKNGSRRTPEATHLGQKSRLLTLKTNLATYFQKSSIQIRSFFSCWLTLFEAWVARCSPNSDFGRAQKSLRTANLRSSFFFEQKERARTCHFDWSLWRNRGGMERLSPHKTHCTNGVVIGRLENEKN